MKVRQTLLWIALLACVLALTGCWLLQFGKIECYNIYDEHSVAGTYCQAMK